MLALTALAVVVGARVGAQQSSRAIAPAWGPLVPGPYAVGFRVVDTSDVSRSEDVRTAAVGHGRGEDAHRHLQASIWYPARAASVRRPRLLYADYVRLMASGRALSVIRTAGFDARQEMRIPPFDSATAAELDSALRVPTAAVLDADRAAGRFPLVVVGEGLTFDSPLAQSILCEYLASHGYVVASIPYLGAPFREAPHDRLGLEGEVRDLEWLLAFMRADPSVDTARPGVVGFDFGGLAALLLAMRNREVAVVVSLDAGIMFRHNLVLLRAFAEYDPARLRVPLMQVTAPAAENTARGLTEDLSLFRAARFSRTYLLRLTGMDHADYSAYGMLWSGLIRPTAPGAASRVSGYAVMGRYVQQFLDAFVKQRASAVAFLDRAPEGNAVPPGLLAVERRSALPAPPTEGEFVGLLLRQGVDSAARVFRAVQAADSGFVPFSEVRLNQLGYELLAWHELRRALAVFQLNVEAFPRSWNAYDSLGEGYLTLSDTTHAIASYQQSLALNPGNANAAAVLARLRAH
jgi:alpha/beta superfamily hydrolase